MNHTTFKLNTRSCLQYVVAIDIVHSYSRSVVYQAMTSIIQEVVTMVTANEKYSLLKSTNIRLQTKLIMNTEQGNAIATEHEYRDRAASIVIIHSYSRSVVYQAMNLHYTGSCDHGDS